MTDAVLTVDVGGTQLRAASVGAPNLPAGWAPHLNCAALETHLGVPVELANGADAAAVGEALFGAGRGYEDVVYLTVSTGIGAGVLLGGRLIAGTRSTAEIGTRSSTCAPGRRVARRHWGTSGPVLRWAAWPPPACRRTGRRSSSWSGAVPGTPDGSGTAWSTRSQPAYTTSCTCSRRTSSSWVVASVARRTCSSPAESWVVDIVPHLAYGAVTAAVLERLDDD